MVCWAVFGFFWLIALQVFCGKMAPRLGYIFAHKPIGNDPPCPTPECDFSVFWSAGHLARAHHLAALYHMRAFDAWGSVLLFPGAHLEPFIYPPLALLPDALISHLAFEPGFFVWTAASFILAGLLLRRAGFSRAVTGFALLCPASLWNTELGQLGLLAGALQLGGFLALRARPWRAGVLLGLLAFKPQYGVLAPAALAGRYSLRAALGFALCCAVLAAASLAAFGWPAWAAYLSIGRAATAQVLGAPFVPSMAEGNGVSIFWALRSLGAGLGLCYAVQGAAALGAMAAALLIWRRRDVAVLDAAALTVLLSLLAVPYGYGEDMTAGSVALAALAQRRGWRIGLTEALFWIWPALCPVITLAAGVLFTPLVVLLALLRTAHGAGLLRRQTAEAALP